MLRIYYCPSCRKRYRADVEAIYESGIAVFGTKPRLSWLWIWFNKDPEPRPELRNIEVACPHCKHETELEVPREKP